MSKVNTVYVNNQVLIGKLEYVSDHVIKITEPLQIIPTPQGLQIGPLFGIEENVEIHGLENVMVGKPDKKIIEMYENAIMQIKAQKSGITIANDMNDTKLENMKEKIISFSKGDK